MSDMPDDQVQKLGNPTAMAKWTTPQLIDLDGVKEINSFIGNLTDPLGIINFTDPTSTS